VLDAVANTGARPVFADIDETLNISRRTVEAALTARTKCVIVVHLFGSPAPIDEIERLLDARGIALMDDAAQALGARVGDRIVGSFGACGIVSCGPGKPLAGAAGGMLVTNDRRLYERASALELAPEPASAAAARTIRFWVWRRFRRYTAALELILDRVFGARDDEVHVNGRLSNIDAGIVLAQLDRLHEHAAERRAHADVLSRRLQDLPGTIVTDLSPDAMVIKLVYVLSETGPSVHEAIEVLAAHGIEAQKGYSPVHEQAADADHLPNTVALWQRVLCVPLETRPRSAALIPFGRRREVFSRVAAGAVDVASG
jgi:dTDP-4-amino-4,6-dideoxygalactose transaminase